MMCREVTKFYPVGDGLFALRDVDLEIRRGEFVVLLGPSGSGKSTLLNILGGIDRPTYGEVFLKNLRYSTLSEDDLAVIRRKEIGIVFQFFNLFPELTARENVGFSMKLAGLDDKEIARRTDWLLDQMGLTARKNHYPSELSGGEQQRVAIARALGPRPSVILADEPTGNLDSVRSKEIKELFRKFNKEEGQTFVVATHDKDFVEYADVVINLVDGKLASRSDARA